MMKKLILCIMSFSLIQQMQAQESDKNMTISDEGNHELRLNIANAIGGMPEVTYEYFPINNMGIGASVAIGAESMEFLNNRAQFTGFYRLYFGKKKSCGFFIEGNMAYSIQGERVENFVYDSSTLSFKYNYNENRSNNFGFGAAIGVKLLARNRFVGEIYAGGGRLFNKSIIGGYPRVGVSLGIRL